MQEEFPDISGKPTQESEKNTTTSSLTSIEDDGFIEVKRKSSRKNSSLRSVSSSASLNSMFSQDSHRKTYPKMDIKREKNEVISEPKVSVNSIGETVDVTSNISQLEINDNMKQSLEKVIELLQDIQLYNPFLDLSR